MAVLDNYLAAEPAIIERLTSEVSDLTAVLSSASLSDVANGQQVTPAVYVVYSGDKIATGKGQSAGQGKRQVVSQYWLTVLAVRNYENTVSGASVRNDAGPMLSQIIKALAGFKVLEEASPLSRTQAAEPGYTPSFGYFPLAWELKLIT